MFMAHSNSGKQKAKGFWKGFKFQGFEPRSLEVFLKILTEVGTYNASMYESHVVGIVGNIISIFVGGYYGN